MPRMHLETRHLGPVEYQPGDIIHFPEGLPAFEDEHEFVYIAGHPGMEPLVLLQSRQTPELGFFAVPVRALDAGYTLLLEPEHLTLLGCQHQQTPEIGPDLVCLALLTLSGQPTANLLSPIVIHPATHRACQVIQSGTRYSCSHPLC